MWTKQLIQSEIKKKVFQNGWALFLWIALDCLFQAMLKLMLRKDSRCLLSDEHLSATTWSVRLGNSCQTKYILTQFFFSKKVPVQYHRTAKLYAKVLMLRVAITTSKDFESRLGIMITFYSVLLISLCIFWTSTLPALIQRVEPIAVSGNRQLVREKDLMRWVMANIGCRARVTWYVARNWRHACVDSYTVRRAHTTVRFKL